MTEEIDFDSRRLCPDGACIGVIGPDGRCSVCGTVDDGAPQTSVALSAPGSDPEAEPAPVPGFEAEAAGDEAAGDDEDNRELCPDGACIGLIGPDGKCKVCGRLKGS